MKCFFKLTTIVLALSLQACMQDHLPITHLVLQPDAAKGQDALFSNGSPNAKYGNEEDLFFSAVHTEKPVPLDPISRSVVQFDLGSIPENSTIQQAYIYLYFNPTSPYRYPGYPGHIGDNAFFIQRTTSLWDESTVTWNTQPQSTTVNQVAVPAATSPTQDYVIDVTKLVQDMVDNKATSYGFFMRHQLEELFKVTFIASSDHPNAALHPKLEINYIAK
ncbi:DNRLRE domain-containing protein [Larkinella rosea]|uniref:DNRLRE domain-containing protein n=1 Tax=Larkinella rosea TaxID=2025312 RepID=A0A3P1BGB9_9BACT|nr:DNRLRE domain-containing protein [Larkinella rosea]RRB00131.1 DNRLRE domain-containing protein [Larkinella rosea]